MKIELELDEKEIGYLHAALGDFHHKMRDSIAKGSLVAHMDERLIVAKELWKKVIDQTGPVS